MDWWTLALMLIGHLILGFLFWRVSTLIPILQDLRNSEFYFAICILAWESVLFWMLVAALFMGLMNLGRYLTETPNERGLMCVCKSPSEWLEPLNPVPVRLDGAGSSVLDELQQVLDEAGMVATFDSKRDITLCAKCGRRSKIPFSTVVPGTHPNDCRRLCPECSPGEAQQESP